MPLIDEQGRVFGKVNAVDAAVAAAVIVLIPVAYAAYLLFRPAPVKIIGVEPSRVPAGRTTRVKISGEHLRPYLRAQFGSEQVHSLLIETPTVAEAEVKDLAPGTYDLTLYDEIEQIAQKKSVLTVVTPEALMPVSIRLVGDFVDLDAMAAKSIVAGMKFGNAENPSEVVAAGSPTPYSRKVLTGGPGTPPIQVPIAGRLQVPATVRTMCALDPAEPRCKINGVVVTADQIVTLDKGLAFVVRTARSDANGPPIDIVVQALARPEIIEQVKPGDRDLDAEAGRVTVTAVQRRDGVQAQTALRYQTGTAEQTVTRNEQLAVADVALRVIVDSPSSMTLNGAPLEVGATFVLETPRYTTRGTITRVTAVNAKP
jgi:hypothetical protein